MTYYKLIIILTIVSCLNQNDHNFEITEWHDLLIKKEYIKINKYLYQNKYGNLYFKSTEISNGIKFDRLINHVYLPEKLINKENNGVEILSKIIDISSFERINDTLFRDKINYYNFFYNSSGGVLSLLQNKNDLVPDEETAIKVGMAVLEPVYGKEIFEFKPFKAFVYDSIWIVGGTMPENLLGGVPYVEI